MDFSSPVTTALLNNINGSQPAGVAKEVKCEICKKHKNQFKFLCRSKKNQIDLNCMMCNYLCKDMNDYEVHVTSELHVEKAKIFKPQQGAEIPPPVQIVQSQVIPIQAAADQPTSSNIPPLLPMDEMQELQTKWRDKLNEKALRQILSKDRKEWNCINCKVTCQSISSWEAHLASKKHRKNKHKFHTYPGISKEFVKRKYQNSFVRAFETVGNEFIEDGVVFYCKRCDVRMETKLQLEIHMSSNQHKLNHPIAPVPVAPTFDSTPVQNNPQLFNFENSSYGYGFRNWQAENYIFNKNQVPASQVELQRQQEMDRQKQLVEQAKANLLSRFPFYAINMQQAKEQESSSMNPEEIPFPPMCPPPQPPMVPPPLPPILPEY